MAKSSSSSFIGRSSGWIGPSTMAEILYNIDQTPPLTFVSQNCSGPPSVASILSLSSGKQVAPPADPHDLLSKGIVLLPSAVGELLPTVELLSRLRLFIAEFCDLPSLWLSICALYALMTWVYDRFSAVPYLRFLGEPQSGKTRCLQVVSQLCYKAIIAGGATSSSAFFRLLDVWRGTFCIDEADYGKSDLYSDIIKILNTGYQDRLALIKSEKSGTSFDPRGFEVFGPKVLTTRKPFEDHALESRCLTYQTSDSPLPARIPRQLPASFYERAQELRNLCLAWRLSNWRRVSGEQDDLLSLSPRLCQIVLPLWAICPDPEFKTEFLSFLGGETATQRSQTPIAVVIESLRRQAENLSNVPNPWHLTVKDTSDLCVEIGSDWGLEQKFTPKAVGALLRSLGFSTFKNRGGSYEFILAKEVLASIEGRHSI